MKLNKRQWIYLAAILTSVWMVLAHFHKQRKSLWIALKTQDDGLVNAELSQDNQQMLLIRSDGTYPIHYAAIVSYNNGMRLLLEAGDDPNRAVASSGSSINGCRPLHIAIENQNPEGVKLLLRFGADVTASDASGRTAYDYASRYPEMKRILHENATK